MDGNICKFNQTVSGDLICTNFVYETDKAQAKGSVCDKYTLGFVVKGEGTLRCDGHTLHLTQGCVFFVAKNVRYMLDGAGELCYFYLCFHGRRADELIARIGADAPICVFDKTEHYARILDFGFDCLHKATAQNLDVFSEAVLLYVLGHLDVDAHAPNDLVTRMAVRTNESFSDAAFSLSVLAAELGYDAKYLSALFKKKKGIGFSQYLRDLRIRHALFLMEQGVVSVKNIAILSGFGDALYFSKIFKEQTGIPPKSYIEKLNNK